MAACVMLIEIADLNVPVKEAVIARANVGR